MWEDLVAKLSSPVVTAETMAEYAAMSHAKRTDVKDVGGFIGGYLRDGRRRMESVYSRDILTYDYDEFDAESLERVKKELRGTAWCLYSTHSHTAQKWRVRILIPMSRAVMPDQFPAVARMMASKLGFRGLDKGSFDLNRLMFWPSVSKDGPYMLDGGAGEALDVDAVLSRYEDWRDASQWPLLPDESAAGMFSPGAETPGMAMRAMSRRGNGRRLEDPTEKKGIIGAFCSVYNVPKAIEKFLPHVYTPCANGHYTHVGSSTTGNALVREGGKFLYSFHGTDPLQGMMLNSWDLVRLALYRDLDADTAPKTRTGRMPSTVAMEKLAFEDVNVKKRYMLDSGSDFSDVDIESPEDKAEKEKTLEAVIEGLDVGRKGVEVKTSNIDHILAADPNLKDRLVYDVFADRIEIHGTLPWKTHSRFWTDKDKDSLLAYLDRNYEMRKNTQVIERAFQDYINNRGVHPVKEYLKGLPEWDGVSRVSRLFVDVLGAADTELNRKLAELVFTAAVRRIMNPGEKYDYCVILHGPEGSYKSTLFAVMGGKWFSDSITSIEGKQGMESLEGVWIAELSELSGLKKSEVEQQKKFISSQVDKFRPAYARRVEYHPRQCVMVGTTNEDLFLKGVNARNRRMPVVEIDPELRKYPDPRGWLLEHRDQLWAEAKAMEAKGEPLYLGNEFEESIREVQDRHNMDLEDPLFDSLRDFLDWWVPWDWDDITLDDRNTRVWDPHGKLYEGDSYYKRRDRVTIAEIMEDCIKMPKGHPNYQRVSRQMGQYLKRLSPEWEFAGALRSSAYGCQKTWKRRETATEGNEVFGCTQNDPLSDL